MNRLERAIFILEEDASLAKDAKPLILEAVLTRPVLAWAVERLRSDGVRRFFAVCGPRVSGEVAGLLPPEAVVSERWTDLEAFLDTGEPVLVLPRAAFPMAEAGPGFAYAAPGRELRAPWRTRRTNQVQGAERVPGWLPVYGPETLAEIETLVRGRDIDCPEGH